jgi:hypothetical protein
MNVKNVPSAMNASKFASFAFFFLACASQAHAQGAAPAMYNVREVVVDYTRFDDPKAAQACGLGREQISATLMNALKDTGVPAIAASDARPVSMGVARIQLVPEIYVYETESLDCVSFVSLTAESKINAVIPPVTTPRHVDAIYWQQHAKLISDLTGHAQKLTEVMQKMAAQFVQQYRLDQPPEISQ